MSASMGGLSRQWPSASLIANASHARSTSGAAQSQDDGADPVAAPGARAVASTRRVAEAQGSRQEVRTLRVAAVQMPSANGKIQQNLALARRLVEQAAQQGAKLILLPEFTPTGYAYSEDIWAAAEPSDGPTVGWLKGMSRRLGVYLGTTFLEAQGDDFYNTFVLTGPDGEEAGRVRKAKPALWESYFFKGEDGPHVIHTALGDIGVGICYENRLASTVKLMSDQSVDLMLMPHSTPSPTRSPMFDDADVVEYDLTLKRLARRYARALGIPTILANKSGAWRSQVPIVPGLRRRVSSTFPGLSTIVDSDGTVKAQLGDGQGVIFADVVLDPARKRRVTDPPHEGRWAFTAPRWSTSARVVEGLGALSYTLGLERRERARAISGDTSGRGGVGGS